MFAYSLLRAVEAKKIELVQQSKQEPDNLTSSEQKQLEFFRNRGSTYLFVAAVAGCLETFLSKKISNLFRLSFNSLTAPSAAQNLWREIVQITAPLCTHLEDAFTDGLKNSERVRKGVETFQGLVEVTATANERKYREFGSKVLVHR